MLTIDKIIDNKNGLFKLEGRLDTNTSRDLSAAFEETLPQLDTLTLDFEKLDYISSAGLRVILFAINTMEDKSQKVKVLHANDSIVEVLELTGFADDLDLE
ncbi:STAS domain-containing protein [Butyrivibrio fibrisolvens]|uniref:STAS domain-containing protein n=1 Tax=Butyrivibrio fibrisolvens TaxID=831 RepID=UPI0003B5A94F|nr:STAS domain-containing protein [Butyrivibrio fibrisolvens]